jgi:hypothetical protein
MTVCDALKDLMSGKFIELIEAQPSALRETGQIEMLKPTHDLTAVHEATAHFVLEVVLTVTKEPRRPSFRTTTSFSPVLPS